MGFEKGHEGGKSSKESKAKKYMQVLSVVISGALLFMLVRGAFPGLVQRSNFDEVMII